MKAVILAGGLGTRLRPLTLTRPKPLLPIANRPHMAHVLALLRRHGVREVVVTTSYRADAFAATGDWAAERDLVLHVVHEDEPLDTAGALRNARQHLDESFVVMNGDVLTDADLGAAAAFHRDRAADATIVVTAVADPSAFGVVPTDADGRVRGFIEKPPPGTAPTNLINAGVYIVEPRVLDRIPPGRWSVEKGLFPEMVAAGVPLYAVATAAYWIDIGTPRAYLQANLDALSGRFAGGGARGDVIVGTGATVAPTARVSSACLGAGATIEDGAAVARSVLLPGARVRRDAVVEDVVLGERAEVGSGIRVARAAVADGTVVVGTEGGDGCVFW